MQLLIRFWQRERRGRWLLQPRRRRPQSMESWLGLTMWLHWQSRSIAFGPGAREFFTELGRRLIRVTGDLMSRCHMIQQISVALQRGNAAAVLDTIEQCNVIDRFATCTHMHTHSYMYVHTVHTRTHTHTHTHTHTLNKHTHTHTSSPLFITSH